MGLFKGLKKVGGFVGKNVLSPAIKNYVPGGKAIVSVANTVGKNIAKPKNKTSSSATSAAQNTAKNLLGGVSGSVNFGNESSKGFIPIIVTIGAVLFGLFTFGGLFRKPRRRR